MNNKGFAVTGIIYGIMLLFVLVVTSFLTIIVGRNRRVDTLVGGVYDKVDYYTETVTLDDTTAAFITQKKGLYKINYNGSNTCLVYLPINTIVITNKIKTDGTSTNLYYLDASSGTPSNYSNYNTLTCIS